MYIVGRARRGGMSMCRNWRSAGVLLRLCEEWKRLSPRYSPWWSPSRMSVTKSQPNTGFGRGSYLAEFCSLENMKNCDSTKDERKNYRSCEWWIILVERIACWGVDITILIWNCCSAGCCCRCACTAGSQWDRRHFAVRLKQPGLDVRTEIAPQWSNCEVETSTPYTLLKHFTLDTVNGAEPHNTRTAPANFKGTASSIYDQSNQLGFARSNLQITSMAPVLNNKILKSNPWQRLISTQRWIYEKSPKMVILELWGFGMHPT